MTKIFDVIAIGGGPAGIFAAINAADSGASILLIEKNPQLGKKILATGNGRCNLTNIDISESNYHGSVASIFPDIFSRYDNIQTIKYFNNLGVMTKTEERGRVFPVTNRASTIVDALTDDLLVKDVQVLVSSTVRGIEQIKGIFYVTLEDTRVFQSKTLILTTGGKAAHQFGSSGDGLFWARKLGHKPTELYAALAPIETEEPFVTDLMGIKFSSHIKAFCDGNIIAEKSGDVLFTHFGISGPGAMGIAGTIAPHLAVGSVSVSIDLLPEISSHDLDLIIQKQISNFPRKTIENIIAGILPKAAAIVVARISGLEEQTNASEVSKTQRLSIVNTLKGLTLTIKRIRPLRDAQVTSGGIPLSEVTNGLESKLVKGMFFAGEILDIDGDSGGFNLQWAWSSGKIAGENASKTSKQ